MAGCFSFLLLRLSSLLSDLEAGEVAVVVTVADADAGAAADVASELMMRAHF